MGQLKYIYGRSGVCDLYFNVTDTYRHTTLAYFTFPQVFRSNVDIDFNITDEGDEVEINVNNKYKIHLNDWEIRFIFPFMPALKGFIGYGQISTNVWPEASPYDLYFYENLQETFSFNYGLGLILNTLNDSLNPTEGYDDMISVGYCTRKSTYTADGLFNYDVGYSIEGKLNNYYNINVTDKFIYQLNTLLHVRLTNLNITYYERYRFGGINTLRGFREHQFRGIKVLLLRNDFIYSINDNLKLKCFLDVGACFNDVNSSDDIVSLQDIFGYISTGGNSSGGPGGGIGYGIGLDLNTKIGLIKVDIAMGNTDSILNVFSSVKIHVGYKIVF